MRTLVALCFFPFFAQAAVAKDAVNEALLSVQDALQTGDLAAASRLLDESLRRYPASAGLLNLRGVIHARHNEVAEARRDFAEAVRIAPALTPAWQNLARACQLEADGDRAAVRCATDAWKRVARSKPDDAEALSALGLLLERQGDYAGSLAALDRSAGAADDPSLSLLRCADLTALGKIDEAKRAASLIASRVEFTEAEWQNVANVLEPANTAEVALILLERLDQRTPLSTPALQRLALAYEQTNNGSMARKTLERVALRDPKNAAHLVELARLAESTKDYEGALGYLAHARDLDPNNAQIHFLFAKVAVELELPLQARDSLSRALAIEPGNPVYNYAMGFVILSTRDAATAAEYFEKFVRAKPREVKGHYALGVAYFSAADYEKAQAEMRLAENDGRTAGGAAYFLGRIARADDHLEEAQRYLRKAIALLPQLAEAHTELARIAMERNDLESAETELNQAVSLDPHSFSAHAQLLSLYQRRHDARATEEAALLKKLDEARSKRAELMLRMVEFRP